MIGTNTCGSDTTTYPILVHPNTVTAFFNTSVLSGCAALTVTFTDFSVGALFISWDFGDGNFSTSQNPVHTYQNAGTYICYEYINNGCSYDTASISITVHPAPTLSFTSNVSIVCANQPVTFTNTSANAVNYNWNFGDGTTSNLTNPTHIYLSGQTYTVTLTGTSTSFGCLDSVTNTIIVNALPIPQIASNVAFGCGPLTINFSNNSQNANFYNWNFGDGSTSTSTLATPSYTYNSQGIYNVNMIAQNLNGCSDSMQLQINVYPSPTAQFTLSSRYALS